MYKKCKRTHKKLRSNKINKKSKIKTLKKCKNKTILGGFLDSEIPSVIHEFYFFPDKPCGNKLDLNNLNIFLKKIINSDKPIINLDNKRVMGIIQCIKSKTQIINENYESQEVNKVFEVNNFIEIFTYLFFYIIKSNNTFSDFTNENNTKKPTTTKIYEKINKYISKFRNPGTNCIFKDILLYIYEYEKKYNIKINYEINKKKYNLINDIINNKLSNLSIDEYERYEFLNALLSELKEVLKNLNKTLYENILKFIIIIFEEMRNKKKKYYYSKCFDDIDEYIKKNFIDFTKENNINKFHYCLFFIQDGSPNISKNSQTDSLSNSNDSNISQITMKPNPIVIKNEK
jgi:hypothetical protein